MPDEVTNEVNYSINSGVLTINDNGATKSTVTLYTISLDNSNPPPNPNPSTLEYDVEVYNRQSIGDHYAGFLSALPRNYYFESGVQYRLEITMPRGVSIVTCPTGFFIKGKCTTSKNREYTYVNGIFTPLKSGILKFDRAKLYGDKKFKVSPRVNGYIHCKLTKIS